MPDLTASVEIVPGAGRLTPPPEVP
jgi:hypothetical protein